MAAACAAVAHGAAPRQTDPRLAVDVSDRRRAFHEHARGRAAACRRAAAWLCMNVRQLDRSALRRRQNPRFPDRRDVTRRRRTSAARRRLNRHDRPRPQNRQHAGQRSRAPTSAPSRPRRVMRRRLAAAPGWRSAWRFAFERMTLDEPLRGAAIGDQHVDPAGQRARREWRPSFACRRRCRRRA